MERDVFENLSIASQMNKFFINIKVDREEYPEIDEFYMVARQLMTHEGGWPNNIFLTPDLKPFYAGGTYAADESLNKPAFPRVLEWINYTWATQEQSVRSKADEIIDVMRPFLVHERTESNNVLDLNSLVHSLFATLQEQHDARSGGFFQAPKFPNECYLNFLLDYYEYSHSTEALAIVTRSLARMAAGGIYDHVGCGFHRYSVDKEWYVPHFEKMLYNQALLANIYTRAALLIDSSYFMDIAKSILDFSIAQFRSGHSAFYAAIDAETDGVEGAYYAWSAEELQQILTPEETQFFVTFYALADIPVFGGHKSTNGKVIVARKPLHIAAREFGRPYAEVAALSAQIMNKILAVRNTRAAPNVDDKIITSWNGLMIGAYARAAIAFNAPRYTDIAQSAAQYILDHGFDNNGRLKRIVGPKSNIAGTLEDYAYFVDGLLALYHATKDNKILESAESLIERAQELFGDNVTDGYYFAQKGERLPLRIKSGDDSTLPNTNAMMLHNLTQLYAITKKEAYKIQAEALSQHFLKGNDRNMLEYATMLSGTLRFDSLVNRGKGENDPAFKPYTPSVTPPEQVPAADDVIFLKVSPLPDELQQNEVYELTSTILIKEGWHINANELSEPGLIATQIDIQSQDIELVDVNYPKPLVRGVMRLFEDTITILMRVKFVGNMSEKPRYTVRLRCQPCHDTICHKVRDISLTF